MKTSIVITGQISGNFKLLHCLKNFDVIEEKHRFNNFELVFKNKKNAIKALSEGYQYLKKDLYPDKMDVLSYSRGYLLSYDASNAKII